MPVKKEIPPYPSEPNTFYTVKERELKSWETTLYFIREAPDHDKTIIIGSRDKSIHIPEKDFISLSKEYLKFKGGA